MSKRELHNFTDMMLSHEKVKSSSLDRMLKQSNTNKNFINSIVNKQIHLKNSMNQNQIHKIYSNIYPKNNFSNLRPI